MRKEIIIAIFVGIIFGGIFAFGIRRANVALKPSGSDEVANPQELAEQSEDNTTIPETADNLTILSPESNDVFTEDTVTITGATRPGSTVIISAETEDFVIQTGENGEFNQEIELLGGLNNILVNSYKDNNPVGNETLKLVYSTEIE